MKISNNKGEYLELILGENDGLFTNLKINVSISFAKVALDTCIFTKLIK